MENVQVSGLSGINGIGGDAFNRAADALASTADSLVLEYQRREQMEQAQHEREAAQTVEIRQKLTSIYEKIGALLGFVGATDAPQRRTRRVAATNDTAQRGRAPTEETEKAKAKVHAFLKANPGMSRGDIAHNTKLDTSLVGRVLQLLASEGSAKMAGERRGAVWSAK